MINIKEPFWSAGQKYGWQGSRTGIGIKLEELNGKGPLFITIADRPEIYQIEKDRARNLVEKYNSIFIARGTKLGVIPLQEFIAAEIIKREPKVEIQKQQTLI